MHWKTRLKKANDRWDNAVDFWDKVYEMISRQDGKSKCVLISLPGGIMYAGFVDSKKRRRPICKAKEIIYRSIRYEDTY